MADFERSYYDVSYIGPEHEAVVCRRWLKVVALISGSFLICLAIVAITVVAPSAVSTRSRSTAVATNLGAGSKKYNNRGDEVDYSLIPASDATQPTRDFVALLEQLRSRENPVRKSAEKKYAVLQQAEPNSVFTSLTGLLRVNDCEDEILRQQAATLLRRSFISEEELWKSTAPEVQLNVRQSICAALEVEPVSTARRILTACVAALADYYEPDKWPELVPGAYMLAKSDNSNHKDGALRLLYILLGTPYTDAILAQRQELGALIAHGLTAPPLRGPAIELVTELIRQLDGGKIKELQLDLCLPMVEDALKAVALDDKSAFEDGMEALMIAAEEKPLFWQARFVEWVDLMLAFAGAKRTLDDGVRSCALEWVNSVIENKPKAILKAVPNLPQRVLEVAFMFMAEIPEDPKWQQVDKNEEEDEHDDDRLYRCGQHAVLTYAQKFGMGITTPPLLALLQQYASCGRWEGRMTAAVAIGMSIEFVKEEPLMDTMANLLVQLMRDENMRVRHESLTALGMLFTDTESKEFHGRWHAKLIPELVAACKDPVERNSAEAVDALESLVADVDDGVLADYAPGILEALTNRLTSSTNSAVLLNVLTTIGTVADVLGRAFDVYYDRLVPMVIPLLTHTGEETSAKKVRGKAFDCISMLGYAVGKDRFAPAAQQTLSALLSMEPQGQAILSDSIREAVERMSKVMGPDFAPFLPALLPALLESQSIDKAVADAEEGEVSGSDADIVPTANGFKKVRSAEMDEIVSVLNLLTAIIKDTDVSFYDYIGITVKYLEKVLNFDDHVLNMAYSIRDSIYSCWAELVGVAKNAAELRGHPAQVLEAELVTKFIQRIGTDLSASKDAEDIGTMAKGIADVVKKTEANCFAAPQMKSVTELAVTQIRMSYEREQAARDDEDRKGSMKPKKPEFLDDLGKQPITSDLGEEAEDDLSSESGSYEDGLSYETDCRHGCVAIFGACMKVSPEVFVSQTWPEVQSVVQRWIAGDEKTHDRVLALTFAADMYEFLKERSVPMWPVLMDVTLSSVSSKDPEQRMLSAFGVVMAAQIESFVAQYGDQAYESLVTCLRKYKTKKHDDDESQMAEDNAVAALAQLCLSMTLQSPNLDKCWELVFDRLPMKVDVVESRVLTAKLFNEAQKPGGGNLGSGPRLVQALGYLCSVYGKPDHCPLVLQRKIAKSFAQVPEADLQSLTSQLTSGQSKKLERILREGHAIVAADAAALAQATPAVGSEGSLPTTGNYNSF